MKLTRKILFPFVPFYFLASWLRNVCYDLGIKSSFKYDIPVICVGNLSVGGTGKTPMIEYLIKLLKTNYEVATLSRGYKRTSKGFLIADANVNASLIGDEPFQFYKKFNDIIVSVDANRQRGIGELIQLDDIPDVILLDDAYQHRKVRAGLNLLLTSYDDLYTDDLLLPAGNLREPKSGAKRADAIIVTKCPEGILSVEKERIVSVLKPLQHQQVFFSTIVYSNTIKSFDSEISITHLIDKEFTLITGIAKSKYLVDFLNRKGLKFKHLNFSDHHKFTKAEIEMIQQKPFVVTTEKDFMRLSPYFEASNKLWYLPIELAIDRSLEFKNLIVNYMNQKLV